MILHPAHGHVLLLDVQPVDDTQAVAMNPDVKLRGGIVHEIGSVPDGYGVGYSRGDTVYFTAKAPLVRWPDGLFEVPMGAIIAWANEAD